MCRNFRFSKGGGPIVCKKIQELSCLKAGELQKQCGLSFKSDSVCDLLKQMEIDCNCVDFAPLEQQIRVNADNHILGIAYSNGDKLSILYSQVLSSKSLNYVLAHELAHCCLHMLPTSKFHVELMTSNDIYSNPFISESEIEKEQEADRFAVELLIPETQLQSAKSKREKQKIAKEYNVPICVLVNYHDYMGVEEND
ncbi:MAG: ImmA/IrrE family metallo-endopeptidase [Prevotellaceae bacterium]|nr:ImmA/IrrE family metallo-endopeptidase [Prevotellaceae bacterium]